MSGTTDSRKGSLANDLPRVECDGENSKPVDTNSHDNLPDEMSVTAVHMGHMLSEKYVTGSLSERMMDG